MVSEEDEGHEQCEMHLNQYQSNTDTRLFVSEKRTLAMNNARCIGISTSQRQAHLGWCQNQNLNLYLYSEGGLYNVMRGTEFVQYNGSVCNIDGEKRD